MVTNEEHATKTWKKSIINYPRVLSLFDNAAENKVIRNYILVCWFQILKENIGISPGDYSEKNNIYTNIRFKKP